MTRYKIDSANKQWDTVVTDPDHFANVRDLQQMMRHYNTTLARRLRRPVMTQVLAGNGHARVRSVYPAVPRTGAYVCRLPIYVSTPTQEITVHMRAAKESGGVDGKFYVSIGAHSINGPVNPTDGLITVNSTSPDDFECTLELPEPTVFEDGKAIYDFDLMLDSTMSGGVIYGPHPVDAGGLYWVKTTTTAGFDFSGHAIVFDDTDVEPRCCSRSETSSKYWNVDRPFNKQPTDVMQMSINECTYIDIHSISVLEKPVTSFHPERTQSL